MSNLDKTAQALRAGEWIKSEGSNPLRGQSVDVEIRRDGKTWRFKSDKFNWDIWCEYRVVPAQQDSQQGAGGEGHGPKCWGRTSYSDEVAHCYCTPSADNDAEHLAVLLDNVVIAQKLSRDLREKAHDEARAYLYARQALSNPSGHTGGPVTPVPVTICCPECDAVHIDEGEWATRPHKTHQCQFCGHEWRPFEYATVGVSAAQQDGGSVGGDLSDLLSHFETVCEYLLGEAPLRGQNFGEEPPTMKSGHLARYWWRSDLRQARDAILSALQSAHPASGAEGVGEYAGLLENLEAKHRHRHWISGPETCLINPNGPEAAKAIRDLLAPALSEGKSATEGEWRPIEEHQGHGPVLVSTAPDSPKYLFSEPVSAFLDITGVWRCLGSIGGGAELARQPTHFRPLPASPTGIDR